MERKNLLKIEKNNWILLLSLVSVYTILYLLQRFAKWYYAPMMNTVVVVIACSLIVVLFTTIGVIEEDKNGR